MASATQTREADGGGLHHVIGYLSGQRGPNNMYGRIRSASATVFGATLSAVGVGLSARRVMDAPWAFVLAFFWFLMIVNLDSALLALIGDRVGVGRWVGLTPRVLALLGTSLLFAESASIEFFSPEIDEQLAHERLEQTRDSRAKIESDYITSLTASKGRLSTEVAEHEKKLAELQGKIATADDRTRVAGQESITAIKTRPIWYDPDGHAHFDSTASRAAQTEEQRLSGVAVQLRTDLKPQIDAERTEIESLRSDQQSEQLRLAEHRKLDLAALATLPSSQGLVARIRALGAVCAADSSAWWFRILLGTVLALIEFMPVAARLGERSDAAQVRERLSRGLREALDSPEIAERMQIWTDANSHRYVDNYFTDLDYELDIEPHRRTDPANDFGDLVSADEHIEHHIRNRTESGRRRADVG